MITLFPLKNSPSLPLRNAWKPWKHVVERRLHKGWYLFHRPRLANLFKLNLLMVFSTDSIDSILVFLNRSFLVFYGSSFFFPWVPRLVSKPCAGHLTRWKIWQVLELRKWTSRWGWYVYHQNEWFIMVPTLFKWMIWGYHYFWKHPHFTP